jgi:FlaA1/EpsC-like NDP-sugar epimerase
MLWFRNRYFLALDLFMLPLAVYTSYVLRFDRLDLASYAATFPGYALTVTLLAITIFRWGGVYSRYWRYASVGDLLVLGRMVLVSSATFGLLTLASHQIEALAPAVPRSIPAIFFLVALIFTAAPRLAMRVLWQRYRRRGEHPRPTPVVIIGAGEAGITMLRELEKNPHLGMQVVGFLDDDIYKQKLQIQGVPVLGDRHALPRIVDRYGIKQAIIAMPAVPGREIRQIYRLCEEAGVLAKIIPGINELLDGSVSADKLRKVAIEDLLRRAPVQTDVSAVQALVRGKRVLVTGGGGSIGGELCRQIWRCRPAELIVIGHGENSIFSIYHELKALAVAQGNRESQVTAIIADIRFAERMKHIFKQAQPQIVFHAAAHKHVPLMESNPSEAVTNNILGTRNVLDAAMAVDVEQFVMISSDKAVNPTGIMGASKRVAEMLVLQAADKTGKPYVAVRFGNVLGSRGSVVFTFQQQIAAGGPVMVTHPDMRRFFMTIPEAVQLVLQAAVLGRGGEIFVLDMGEPVKIVDLARDLIELSGLEVGRDIEIAFSGLRPGEKLYEELFVSGEEYQRTRHEKIFIAHNASLFVEPSLDSVVHFLQISADRDDHLAVRRGLQSLIPEGQLVEEQKPLLRPVPVGDLVAPLTPVAVEQAL